MFIKASAEFQERDHPIHVQSSEHKHGLMKHFIEVAKAADLPDPENLARQLMILKEGAIIMAVMGHSENPAVDAKATAKTLIDVSSSLPKGTTPAP